MTKLDPRALRDAFGSFMTGVTVVTACAPDGTAIGFTANSFTSVSLDPPMLLVCPGKFLSTFEAFSCCQHFAVNILAEDQQDISNTFARRGEDRFASVAHTRNHRGVPLIEGALASFSCISRQCLPAGDHAILLGEVEEFQHGDGRGLGYFRGQYFSLGLERSALDPGAKVVTCGVILEIGGRVLLEKTDKGFRPPQVNLKDHSLLRQSLIDGMARQGISVKLGPAYSVFDDAGNRRHCAYFLATGSVNAAPENLHGIALQELAGLDYASPAIAQMMTRYMHEQRTGDFSLYLGSTDHGDVHKFALGD